MGQDGSSADLPEIEDFKVSCYQIPVHHKRRNIASIYIEYKKTPSDYVILFSHGNSTDLGYMLDCYLDLAYNCKINVFSYDY